MVRIAADAGRDPVSGPIPRPLAILCPYQLRLAAALTRLPLRNDRGTPGLSAGFALGPCAIKVAHGPVHTWLPRLRTPTGSETAGSGILAPV